MTPMRTDRRSVLLGGAALAVATFAPSACDKQQGLAEDTAEDTAPPQPPSSTAAATPAPAQPGTPGIPRRESYTFPPDFEEPARGLRQAGLRIVFGPNSVPAPAGISAQAKSAWANQLLGVSAGGGLTLATLLRLKRDGLPLPGAAAALCPGADMTHSGYLFTAVGLNDPVLSPYDIDRSMRAYVAGASPTDPLVSPVFGDFTGCPPLFLLATTAEIIGSDGIRVAQNARNSGVDVTLAVSDGMWHVPVADGSGIPEVQQAYDQLIGFLRRRLPG